MRAPYSLRRRLLAFLLIPLTVIGFIALFDAYRSARDTANEVFDRVLSGSALAMAERIFVNDDGLLDVDIPYVALDMLTSAAQDRVFYRLESDTGDFITGYEKLDVPATKLSEETRFSFHDASFRGAAIRIAVYQGAASTGERTMSYRVAVAETRNARDQLTQEILIRTALRQFFLIAAAAIIVWIAVTRSLRPLVGLQEAIGRRNSDDLRPIRHHVPTEVGGLVVTINGFMKRLDTALGALRHFTGNASHQLRTPLTIIRTQLALAQRSNNLDEAQAVLADCDQAVVDAERTLAQLLLLARIDETSSKSLETLETDITALAKSVTESMVVEAAKAGYDLGFEGGESTVCKIDPVLFRELLNNLIDNALKHASGGDEITVSVVNDQDAAILTVEDNGCGISEELQEKVTDRFFSNTEGQTTSSGLGLAIVNEIVAVFKGQMILSNRSPDKGLKVILHIPAMT